MIWRRIALALFVSLGVVDLTALARRGGPTWSVGDGAMIELYTVHATNFVQLLGAYSQYGWQHPGPMFFYLLAPFYVLGGHSVFGLDAGALALNVASVAILAFVVARDGDRAPVFAVVLCGLLLAYLLRLPGLLTSAWNPHPPVLALVALIAVCAACLCGRGPLLPLAAVLASFVTQTHVGFVPVVAALGAVTVGGLLVAAGRAETSPSLGRWSLLSVAILEALWLAPVAQQLVGHPGNMTELWRFFFGGGPTQPLGGAWRAWSGMLAGVLRGDFDLARGGAYSGSAGSVAGLVATIAVLALAPVAVWAGRTGRRLYCALAVLSLTASVAAFWSTSRILGLIGDYQVFWLSALGVLNLALVLGALLTPVAERFAGERWLPTAAALAAAALALGTYAAGRAELVAATRASALDPASAAVRSLSEQVFRTMPSMGNHRALIRPGGVGEGIAPGFVVQMSKGPVPITVDAAAAPLYGPALATTGGEDVLLTLCGPALHRELAARPRNVTLATFDGGPESGRSPLFVDAISLVDAPEYRNAP